MEVSDVQSIPKRKKVFVSPKKNKRMTMIAKQSNSRADEAYHLLKMTVANKNVRDESTIYGEHIASKHRKYSTKTRSVIEYLIADILFKADMGTYEQYVPPISPATHLPLNIRHGSYSIHNQTPNNPSPSSSRSSLVNNQPSLISLSTGTSTSSPLLSHYEEPSTDFQENHNYFLVSSVPMKESGLINFITSFDSENQ